MTLRSVIIDDEPAARELLKEMLGARPDIEVVGVYGDTRAAIAGIRRDNPDLVFLDVQMPGRNGFEVLDELGADSPPVVFVTAHDEYALQAFDVSACDYVLKPVDQDRLFQALDRAISRIQSGEPMETLGRLAQLIREARSRGDAYLRYLPIRVKDKLVFQRVNEVSWFEADGKYVRIHARGEPHLIRKTISSLEGRLDPARFVRVCRSAIVNIEMVQHLEPWSHGEWVIVLPNGQRVISTHGYREGLQRLLRAV